MTDFGRPSTAHKLLHQDGGGDEISVAALSGQLADEQLSAWGSVSGKPSTFIATSHKTRHQAGGDDEINCALLSGRINYVDRGDPAAADFTRPNLDTDGSIHDMDLSSIVPEGAIAVYLRCNFSATGIGIAFTFTEKGNSNVINYLRQYTQASEGYIVLEGFVALDANRVISYKTSNDAFASYSVSVRGWFI